MPPDPVVDQPVRYGLSSVSDNRRDYDLTPPEAGPEGTPPARGFVDPQKRPLAIQPGLHG